MLGSPAYFIFIYNVGRRRVKNNHFLMSIIENTCVLNMDRIKTFCKQIGPKLCHNTKIYL